MPHGRSHPQRILATLSALVLVGVLPTAAGAQQPAPAAASLVFDGVTVVDVERGALLPAQRVVIAGNRIQAVGGSREVTLPPGAQVVEARDKYLIPGLWDLHRHVGSSKDLVQGVTGVRQPQRQRTTVRSSIDYYSAD